MHMPNHIHLPVQRNLLNNGADNKYNWDIGKT